MSELREGLADHLYGVIPFGECTRNDAETLADSVLAYLHDGHAEFVRKIREQADDERFTDAYSINRIIALCDAELAKEMSNG